MNAFNKYCVHITAAIVISLSIWLAGNLGAFGVNKIKFDVISYHAYTAAVFVKKDISLNFFKDSSQYYTDKGMYWANFTENGNPIIKTTYGISLMNLPFTIWPILFGSFSNGYELPFSIAIATSNLTYFVLSVFLLINLLQKMQFNKIVICLTLICVFIGTNYFAYSAVDIGVAHVYNFFLLLCILNLLNKWHNSNSLWVALCMGFLFGLLVLIRPTNIILALVFFICENKFKIHFNKKYILKLTLFAVCAFLIVLPQLLYWKFVSGKYFYNSYVGEKFYFNNPHIINYLFGFRKGWFVYSPLILLSLIGLFFNKKRNPFFYSTLIIVLIFIYLNSCWWCWWFGGGLGARAMIETYPLLAIGFAVFFEKILIHKHYAKHIIYTTIFLVLFNTKTVGFYRSNYIHYDSMTFKAFIYTSYKLYFFEEDKQYVKTLINPPNYKKALLGEDA